MYKVMIIIAVLVGVLAIGGVAAVVVIQHRAEAQKEADSAASAVAAAPATATSVKVKPTKKTVKAPVAAVEPVESDASATSATDAAAAPPAPAGTDAAATDVTALLKNLSPEQESQLLRALQGRERERRQQEMRYSLPSNTKISALKNLNNPELKVSEAQQQRLSAIQETLKPRMEASLSPIWTRMDEIGQSMRDTFQNAQTDEERQAARQQTASFRSEMQDLMQKSDAIKQQFDQQFMTSAQTVLSAEQVQAMQAMPATPTGRGFGGGPGGGGNRGGGGGGRGGGNRGGGGGAAGG